MAAFSDAFDRGSFRRGRRPALIAARTLATLLGLLLLGLPTAAEAATTRVTLRTLGDWAVSNYDSANDTRGSAPTTSGTKGEFVDGPATPPAGSGSFRQTVVNGDDGQSFASSGYNGADLEDLDELEYQTFVRSDGDQQATYLQLYVDTDGDGARDDILFFEPVYQSGTYATVPGVVLTPQCAPAPLCVLRNRWQSWDAAEGGWWSLNAGTFGPPLTTLAAYALAHPGAKLATNTPALRLTAGFGAPSWNGFDGNVDAVKINGTLFDLEPALVDCDATASDIAAVQSEIDAAGSGETVYLKGVCDFSAAAAHGGDVVSIASAAVVVRRSGITIESLGAAQSARIIGSGTQTAFFVAPGTSGVTIRGLTLQQFARPIVAINTSNTTVGAGDTVPHPEANRIIGDATMNSAILGTAVDRGSGDPSGTYTIRHGAGGAIETAFSIPAGQGLSGFRVLGNYITYAPPGVPDGATKDIAAIDVRQRFYRVVDGVRIEHNAVGMFASEFASFNMNGVRVHALTPTHDAPTPDGYFIRNVRVNVNNLGRLEELDSLPIGDTNAGDIHAAGRVGILLMRAGNFQVNGNGVRARLSSTGPVPMPGGGIVVSDSSAGEIRGNGIVTVADPSTLDADLGAIGLIDDVVRLFGGSAGPPTSRIVVTDNIVGPVGSDTPALGSQRGILLNGVSHSTLGRNNIKFSSWSALNIGSGVSGPGSAESPGLRTLANPVIGSVACQNVLDGRTDNRTEVHYNQAISSTANSFPGGGDFGDNMGCPPLVQPTPTIVGSGAAVTVTGRAWAARPLQVRLSGSPAGASAVKNPVVDSSGRYSATFSAADLSVFDDGAVCAVATSSDDLASSLSQASESRCVRKKVTAPAAPVITVPSDGALINTSVVTVRGTAEAASTVTVLEGGVVVGTTTAASSGAWQTNVSFAEGPHSITAKATDVANNTSSPSSAVGFTVDTQAPAAPSITTPADGTAVNTSPTTVSGQAEAGSTVTVLEGGVSVGTATAGPSGTWQASIAFPDGAHTLTATATDAAQNTGPASPAVTFRLDTVAPPAPIITTPVGGSLHNTFTITVGGTAEAGSHVRVFEGAALRATAMADATGAWQTDAGFADGSHTVHATATDAATNTGPASAPVAFRVDTEAPGKPVITTPAAGTLTNSTLVAVGGTAEPGTTVRVLDGGAAVGTAAAGPGGAWEAEIAFADGSHTITATATDEAGNTGAQSDAVPFRVDATAPEAPAITAPAHGALLGTAAVGVRGTSEAGATVKVRENGSVIGSALAAPDGTWEVAITFGDGAHSITATATDEATNTSAPSTPVSFRVDTTAPPPPAIATPADGALLNTGSVTVEGSAEAGSLVSVLEGPTVVGTATANPAGTFTLSLSFADGVHTIRATSTDGAGNESADSAPVAFRIDTQAPAAPAITTPANGALLATATVSIAGNAEPGALVRVLEGASVIGTATANAGGAWSLGASFADGGHSITATASDAAGNTSPASPPVTFRIDTVAPDAPVITAPQQDAVLASTSVAVSGIAEAGAGVRVLEGGALLGTATADPSGRWSTTITAAEGLREIVARATDAAGNTGAASAIRRFRVDLAATGVHPFPAIVSPAPFSVHTATSTVPVRWSAVSGGEPIRGYVLLVGRPGDTSRVYQQRVINGAPGGCTADPCETTLAFPLSTPGGALEADDKYAMAVVALYADGHRSDGRCDDGSPFGSACPNPISHAPGYAYSEFLIKSSTWSGVYRDGTTRDVLLVSDPAARRFEFINWRPGLLADTMRGVAAVMAPNAVTGDTVLAHHDASFSIAMVYGTRTAAGVATRGTAGLPRLIPFSGQKQ